MKHNGDIRGFFARRPVGSASTPAAARPAPETTTAPPISSSPPDDPSAPGPSLPSSPITPQRPAAKAPLNRNDVIKGSDEEDSDGSDDSLESLSAFYARKPEPASRQQDASQSTSSPRAKRLASADRRSPPTLQTKPPKHKFDLKALVKHARQDNAAVESARKAGELLQSGAAEEVDLGTDPGKLREAAKVLISDNDEDSKGDKFVRAMNRTQGDESRPCCYFFDPVGGPPQDVPKEPFPKKAAKGPWGFLGDASTREQSFIRGLPAALIAKGRELPDELFMWVLGEACLEPNVQLRAQYCKLVELCPNNTRRLISAEQLYTMMERVGGPTMSQGVGKFPSSSSLENPYSGRDWSFVATYLQLLERMAPCLRLDAATSAIQLLLRMALDPIVSSHAQVRTGHYKAMVALVSALPTAQHQWDSCFDMICSYLLGGVDEASHRHTAISLIPAATPRLCEFRYRLAARALFESSDHGAPQPDSAVTLDLILSRLAAPDFQVTHTTDFSELRANIALLDMVLEKQLFIRHGLQTAPRLATPGQDYDNAEAVAEADKAVDVVARRLKAVHDKINDNTLVSRKEAKTALEAMDRRLTLAVRTRPRPKASIFDMIPGEEKEDVSLPKQRDFMKKWAQRRAEIREGSSGTRSKSRTPSYPDL